MMNTFFWLYITFLTILLIRSIINSFNLLYAIFWIKKNYAKNCLNNLNNNLSQLKNYFIIIPVLKEQKRLPDTLEHFSKMNYCKSLFKIILVSTEKEFLANDAPTTVDVIKELIGKYNTHNEFIIHLHYPKPNGKMVDQLNYAFDYLLKINIADNSLVAIYNADSKPHLDTLKIVDLMSNKSNIFVLQQSSLFVKNIEKFKGNFFAKGMLLANSILQTKWTLTHEIPRLLKQSFFINNFGMNWWLAHCVGHGLFIKKVLLEKIRSLPSFTLTEDLFLGYILCNYKISINPICLLENADSPDNIWSMIKQKYVWFFGPLDYFSYQKYAKKLLGSKYNSIIASILSLQGILSAIAWLISGWIVLMVLFLPLFFKDRCCWFAASILAYAFYGPVPYLYIMIELEKLGKLCSSKINIRTINYFQILIFCLPNIFLHSIIPIYSVIQKVNSVFWKIEPPKPKT